MRKWLSCKLAFALAAIVMMSLGCGMLMLLTGCGSDESVSLSQSAEPSLPNYFPDAIGSRWIYSGPHGKQWVREVTHERPIGENVYRVFTYTPSIEDATFDLLRISRYRVTQNRVLTFVEEDIDRYVKAKVPEFRVQGAFEGIELEVQVNSISERELVFYRIPPTPNLRWDVLDVKVEGNVVLQGLGLLQLAFEMHLRIKGTVVGLPKTVQTPAGTFENTYKIEYQSGYTLSILDKEETTPEVTDTVWLAPHVGIVRFENAGGVTELVDYTLP